MSSKKNSDKSFDPILDFLPAFHRIISPAVNEASFNGHKLLENHIKILMVLKIENRPLTPGEISLRLNIQKGSLTRMLRALETLNLILRKDDEEDERRYNLQLTGSGRNFLKDHTEISRTRLAEIFRDTKEDDLHTILRGFSLLNRYLADKGFENEK